jgi:glucosamine-phosphate N-acetyltransferase
VSTFIPRFLRRPTLTRPFTFSLCKLGTQGHIEDIAIKADQQGKKFGVKLLQALDYVAENVGCYKVCGWSIVLGLLTDIYLQTILDCSPPNEGFYVKCGYEKAGSEMHHYYSEEALKNGV